MIAIYGLLAWVNDLLGFWFAISPERKFVLSLVGTGIALSGYAWTINRTRIGEARPNPLSWFGFGFLTGVGAAVQYFAQRKTGDSGIGSLTMAVTAVACFAQGGASLYWRRGGWRFCDFSPLTWKGFWSWVTFVLGVACFIAYERSEQIGLTPFGAATFATLSDLFLYGPIILESWNFPRSENPFGYKMQSLKNIPAIASLSVYAPETWMYNMMLLWMNLAMVGYFRWRRRIVTEEQEKLNEAEAAGRRKKGG